MGAAGEQRIITTADALRALPHHSPARGWHSHANPPTPATRTTPTVGTSE